MTKIGIARTATAALAILVVGSGVAFGSRYAGICILGIEQVLAACPLGFLERSLASRELLPQLWFGVAVVVLSVILLGRVFCAWVCPASLVRRLLRGKATLQVKRQAAQNGATTWSRYSPYAVLGGVLFASFLFRFPVFCFFCPVGLVFGSIFAVMRFFSPEPQNLELVLFPVLLGLELLVLKSWCRSICPLGALLSIIGSLNRFFRPAIKQQTCLVSKGINCQACRNACPEGIDLRNQKSVWSLSGCTKCLECYDKCPARAIKIAVLS